MKRTLFLTITAAILCGSCELLINNPDEPGSRGYQRLNLQTRAYFPFENNTNWWSFTESSGNQLDIQVTDTISDDNTMYYRVSFREHQVDTTDDWFKRISGTILFGTALTGTYDTLLPSRLDYSNGSFSCRGRSVKYSHRDSAIINGVSFQNILTLKYSTPIIHGFEEITLAESIGVIQLKDYDGRWPVCYTIDSCMVDSTKHVF